MRRRPPATCWASRPGTARRGRSCRTARRARAAEAQTRRGRKSRARRAPPAAAGAQRLASPAYSRRRQRRARSAAALRRRPARRRHRSSSTKPADFSEAPRSPRRTKRRDGCGGTRRQPASRRPATEAAQKHGATVATGGSPRRRRRRSARRHCPHRPPLQHRRLRRHRRRSLPTTTRAADEHGRASGSGTTDRARLSPPRARCHHGSARPLQVGDRSAQSRRREAALARPDRQRAGRGSATSSGTPPASASTSSIRKSWRRRRGNGHLHAPLRGRHRRQAAKGGHQRDDGSEAERKLLGHRRHPLRFDSLKTVSSHFRKD